MLTVQASVPPFPPLDLIWLDMTDLLDKLIRARLHGHPASPLDRPWWGNHEAGPGTIVQTVPMLKLTYFRGLNLYTTAIGGPPREQSGSGE